MFINIFRKLKNVLIEVFIQNGSKYYDMTNREINKSYSDLTKTMK